MLRLFLLIGDLIIVTLKANRVLCLLEVRFLSPVLFRGFYNARFLIMGLLKIVILNEVKNLYPRFTDIRVVLTALNMTFLEHLIIEALSLCADNYPTTRTVLLELLPS